MTDIVGDNGSNTLTGDVNGIPEDDYIRGLGGNDIISGLGGNDRLAGGSGTNTLTGGAGNDIFEMETRSFHTDTITDYTIGEDQIDLSILNVGDLATLMPYISPDGDDIRISTFWNDINGSTPNEVIIIQDVSFNDLANIDFIFNTDLTPVVTSLNSGNDYVLFGGNGNDTLTQLGNGDDELNGGAGDDVLTGGFGTNILRGGTGADTFVMTSRGAQTQQIEDYSVAEGDIIDINVLNVADLATLMPYISQDGDDLVIRTFWNDINGDSPNEVIVLEDVSFSELNNLNFTFNSSLVPVVTELNSGNDYVLFGGNGDDILTQLGNGDDELNGGAGDDELTGGYGSNILRGGTGADTFIIEDRGTQTQTIADFSQADGDQIDLRALNVADLETLMPYMEQVGDDVHISTFWNDINGNSPNEVIIIEDTQLANLDSSDFLFFDFNIDLDVDFSSGNDYVLFGGNGDDELTRSGSGDDELNGGAGNDVLDGGGGDDIIRGGAGDDTIVFSETNTSATNIDTNIGGEGVDTFRINNLNMTDETYAVDLALGQFNYVGSGAQTGFGGTLRGTLDGIENVTITSDANINVRGDSGDNVIVSTSLTAVNVLQGGFGFDTIDGGGGDDIISGGAGGDMLFGGAGNDFLAGDQQNDILDGGTGADIMVGGIGNDVYFVDEAGDRMIEEAGEGYDIINTVRNVQLLVDGDNLERVNFVGEGNFTGRGNELANRFSGGAGNDKFILDSGGGDIFSGGAGRDAFDARASTNGITIRLDDQSLHGGDAAGDFFASIESFFGSNTAGDFMVTGAARARFSGFGGDDTLIGGDSVDFLQGGADNDTLDGGAARDTLQGGTGNDMLTGGSGRDQFLYVEDAFGQDTITDFEDGLDFIRIFRGVTEDFSGFTVAGNGTTSVTITLNDGSGNNVITVNSTTAITITAADFQFYGNAPAAEKNDDSSIYINEGDVQTLDAKDDLGPLVYDETSLEDFAELAFASQDDLPDTGALTLFNEQGFAELFEDYDFAIDVWYL